MIQNLTILSKPGMVSNIRFLYSNYFKNTTEKRTNINDPVIIKVVYNYYEIFPNICLKNNDEYFIPII